MDMIVYDHTFDAFLVTILYAHNLLLYSLLLNTYHGHCKSWLCLMLAVSGSESIALLTNRSA